MTVCAHPNSFEYVLSISEAWVGRIRGIRRNAELDKSTELDIGNPAEFECTWYMLPYRSPYKSFW
jgi:hypothetical protein